MNINIKDIDPTTPAGAQLLDAIRTENRVSEREKLEARLLRQLQAAGLVDGLECQYVFLPGRRFRADFAWPRVKFIVEVDGGIYMRGGKGGGHNTGSGYDRDRRRDALALLEGWKILRVTAGMIADGFALDCIERILKNGHKS